MTVVQGSAGNAYRRPPLRLGAVASSIQHGMVNRLALITLTLALALLPATAHASDPLLSGYAGPGGGEQVVLGGGTVGGGKGGGSSSSSSASGKPAADVPLKATATPAATAPTASDSNAGTSSSTLTSKPQRKKSPSSSSKDAGDDDTAHSTTTTTPSAAALPHRLHVRNADCALKSDHIDTLFRRTFPPLGNVLFTFCLQNKLL